MAKYEEWLTEDGLLLIAAWARNGLTIEQIAGNVGVAAKTLYEWRNTHSKIREALKKSRDLADIEVENALFKKTQGYTVQLNKAFKVRRIDYDEKTGKKLREYEEIVSAVDEVHIPADTTAQIFWLTNRKPDDWKRDRKNEVEADESGETGVALMPDAKEGEPNNG